MLSLGYVLSYFVLTIPNKTSVACFFLKNIQETEALKGKEMHSKLSREYFMFPQSLVFLFAVLYYAPVLPLFENLPQGGMQIASLVFYFLILK